MLYFTAAPINLYILTDSLETLASQQQLYRKIDPFQKYFLTTFDTLNVINR